MRSNLLSVLTTTVTFALFLTFIPISQVSAATVYVANGNDNTVSAIDTNTGSTIATIGVGASPRSVINYKRFVYVANYNGSSVTVINGNTNTVFATISLPTNGEERMAISPDGSTLYVSDLQNTVYVINTSTNTLSQTLTGFSDPQGLAVSPDGLYLYVVNQNCCDPSMNGWVSVLNTSNYETIATINVGVQPSAIVISPDGTTAYAVNNGGVNEGNTVSVIDTTSDSITNTITVGINPYAIVISPNGNKVYVLNTYYWAGGDSQTAYGTVSVIDTSTDVVRNTIQVGYVPNSLQISRDGLKLYVSNSIANNVSIINTDSNTATGSLDTGDDPWGMALRVN